MEELKKTSAKSSFEASFPMGAYSFTKNKHR